jgi:hypothetical protein
MRFRAASASMSSDLAQRIVAIDGQPAVDRNVDLIDIHLRCYG